MKTLKVDNVAQAYLELLEDRGVDFFLANAGTDFATLVDAFARREAEGKRAPRPMVVPHESVAVGMAHGAWLGHRTPAGGDGPRDGGHRERRLRHHHGGALAGADLDERGAHADHRGRTRRARATSTSTGRRRASTRAPCCAST